MVPPLSEPIAWGDIAVATTAILGICALIGLAVRFGLVPYLRTELIEPTREVNRQVTGTATAEPAPGPTMRDDLDTMRGTVSELRGEIHDATLELRAMALMFDGHLEWSQEETDRLWTELKRQRDAGERPAPGGRHKGRGTDENG